VGPVALGLQVVMLAAGWWYNLHAKFHWSSPLSYLVGFGLLPAFAGSATDTPVLPAFWVFVVAGLLGVAAHFANALPDLRHDTAHGIRGLPQILGPKRSGVAVLVGAVSAAGIIVVYATGTPWPLRFATGLVAMALALGASVMAFRPTPPRAIFPMVMVVAVLCVVGLGFSL
jgi:4-hydroxybenzoate polyprenyltransferase